VSISVIHGRVREVGVWAIDSRGFCVLLTKVMREPAALQGTSNFQPTEIFYWGYGDKGALKRDLKVSKSSDYRIALVEKRFDVDWPIPDEAGIRFTYPAAPGSKLLGVRRIGLR
jgi:hypothetical protein